MLIDTQIDTHKYVYIDKNTEHTHYFFLRLFTPSKNPTTE